MLLIFLATFCTWCSTHETDRGQVTLGILAPVGWALYEPVTVAWRGQTLGKAICRIKIIRTSDGDTPHLGQAIVRWAIPMVAGEPRVTLCAPPHHGTRSDSTEQEDPYRPSKTLSGVKRPLSMGYSFCGAVIHPR